MNYGPGRAGHVSFSEEHAKVFCFYLLESSLVHKRIVRNMEADRMGSQNSGANM